MNKTIRRFAGFTAGENSGNPAGVLITENIPNNSDMLAIAKQIGDSETVFAQPANNKQFNIKYFSPEAEVDFCGHATIALGQAIKQTYGSGIYLLNTNKGTLELDVQDEEVIYFSSPQTSSRALTEQELLFVLQHSSVTPQDINSNITPAMVNAGNDHIFIALNNLEALHKFNYEFEQFKVWMQKHNIVTIAVAIVDDSGIIYIRNAFAYGGVYEDPATGAAAAAVSGYLRDNHLTKHKALTFHQGIEMNQHCVLKSSFSDVAHSSIRVGGTASFIAEVTL